MRKNKLVLLGMLVATMLTACGGETAKKEVVSEKVSEVVAETESVETEEDSGEEEKAEVGLAMHSIKVGDEIVYLDKCRVDEYAKLLIKAGAEYNGGFYSPLASEVGAYDGKSSQIWDDYDLYTDGEVTVYNDTDTVKKVFECKISRIKLNVRDKVEIFEGKIKEGMTPEEIEDVLKGLTDGSTYKVENSDDTSWSAEVYNVTEYGQETTTDISCRRYDGDWRISVYMSMPYTIS